ncbi:hypothetical protein R50073_42490 [Maricurvus nonylphenolicus]|uniref:substrate-binding periplasmic protein n=1 Tax=Maricurvus nonylphenolicus TaxID=1008307 RepID=UPI0036F3BC61
MKVCSFELAPYYYKSQEQVRGILVDIIDQISATMGLQADYAMMPPLRCARHVIIGSMDVMPYTSGYLEQLIYTEVPVHFYIAGFIVKDDSDFKSYKGLRQFENKSVGILRGNPQLELLQQHINVQWTQVNSGSSQWRMLLSGRLSAAYGDLIALTALPPYQNKQIRFLHPAYSTSPMWMGFHPSRKIWRDRFNRELERMLNDGTIAKIYRKHSSLSFEKIQSLANISNDTQALPIEP